MSNISTSVKIKEWVVEASRNAPPNRVDSADRSAKIHYDLVAGSGIGAALPGFDGIRIIAQKNIVL